VPILNIGIEKEYPFVVREYLTNGSLRSRLKKIAPDRLELKEALTIVLGVGEALVYLHEHNTVHGNIKPENVLFGANGQIFLADPLLIARNDAFIRDQSTQEYAFCYTAPEQFTDTSNARTDQYALGCLAYELITGRVPFARQSLTSMMGERANILPAPLSESVATLPPSFEIALFKALARDPAERFFDFSLFLDVIQSVLSPPPAFPLLLPTYSRKNTTSSQPVHRECDSLYQPLMVQRSNGSTTIFLEVPSDGQTVATPITEKDTNALPSSNPSVEEQTDTLPVEGPASSTYKQSSDTTNKMAPTSTPHSGQTVQIPYSTRIVIGSVHLLLVIGTLVIYTAFSPFRIVQAEMFWHPTQVVRQAVTQIKNSPLKQPSAQVISTVTAQVPAQATSTVTAQAISTVTAQVPAQATNNPVTQRPVQNQASNAPIVLSPSPTPTPQSYEAEASQNTLTGDATILGCGTGASACSGGYRVGYIGLNTANNEMGNLQFNNINKSISGNYTLTIHYLMVGSDTLTGYMSVNGGPAEIVNFPSLANGDVTGTASITISLKAGNNTIEFSNPSTFAPDIDRIVV
jgi:serine/threonine protein kinase